MAFYLGFDASTQSLTATILDIDIDLDRARRDVAFEHTINFDEAFPGYRTTNGVVRAEDGVTVTTPPVMAVAALTGSRAYERFTGAQIHKFATAEPEAYARTDRIHLVRSFFASMLAGIHAPIDPGDGAGMNLMDLASRTWAPAALNAAAPDLARRLPPLADSWTVVGELAPYWQRRFGFGPAKVIA